VAWHDAQLAYRLLDATKLEFMEDELYVEISTWLVGDPDIVSFPIFDNVTLILSRWTWLWVARFCDGPSINQAVAY
jgi:hypothetical protein